MIEIVTTAVDEEGSFRLGRRHHLQLVLAAALCALALLLSALVDQTLIQPIFLTIDVPTAELDPEEQAELSQHFESLRTQKFWQVDVYAVQNQIKSLNWIDDIYVKKHWPDTVELNIVTAAPVAVWNDGFLTATGDLIKTSRSQAGLPKVDAPESLVKAATQLLGRISEQLGPVEELSMNAYGEVEVTLPTGLRINFGADQFALHLERAKKIIKKHAQEKQLASIDLRYSGGAAVSWHGYPKTTSLLASNN